MSLSEAQFIGSDVVKQLVATNLSLTGLDPVYVAVMRQPIENTMVPVTGPRTPIIHIAPIDRAVSVTFDATAETIGFNALRLNTTGAIVHLAPNVQTLGFMYAQAGSTVTRVHLVRGVPMSGA